MPNTIQVAKAETWIGDEPTLVPEPQEPMPDIHDDFDLIAFPTVEGYKKSLADGTGGYESWCSGLPYDLRPHLPSSIQSLDYKHGIAASRDSMAELEYDFHLCLKKARVTPMPQPDADEEHELAERAPAVVAPLKRAYRRAVSASAALMIAGVQSKPRSLSEPESTGRRLGMALASEAEERSALSDVASLELLIATTTKAPMKPRMHPQGVDIKYGDKQDDLSIYEGLGDFFTMAEQDQALDRNAFKANVPHLDSTRAHLATGGLSSAISSFAEPWPLVGDSFNNPSFKTEATSFSTGASFDRSSTISGVSTIKYVRPPSTVSSYMGLNALLGVEDEGIIANTGPPKIARYFPAWTPHCNSFRKAHLLRIPSDIRFRIYEYLLEPAESPPVLLSPSSTTLYYWPKDAFISSSVVLDKMWNATVTCHQLRDELMTFYLTQFRFHITLNCHLLGTIAPKLFKWVPLFVHQIQHLTIELDYTKASGSRRDHSALLPDGVEELQKLLGMVIEPMAKRETPAKELNIMVRRYDGFRPSSQMVRPVPSTTYSDNRSIKPSVTSVTHTGARCSDDTSASSSATSGYGEEADLGLRAMFATPGAESVRSFHKGDSDVDGYFDSNAPIRGSPYMGLGLSVATPGEAVLQDRAPSNASVRSLNSTSRAPTPRFEGVDTAYGNDSNALALASIEDSGQMAIEHVGKKKKTWKLLGRIKSKISPSLPASGQPSELQDNASLPTSKRSTSLWSKLRRKTKPRRGGSNNSLANQQDAFDYFRSSEMSPFPDLDDDDFLDMPRLYRVQGRLSYPAYGAGGGGAGLFDENEQGSLTTRSQVRSWIGSVSDETAADRSSGAHFKSTPHEEEAEAEDYNRVLDEDEKEKLATDRAETEFRAACEPELKAPVPTDEPDHDPAIETAPKRNSNVLEHRISDTLGRVRPAAVPNTIAVWDQKGDKHILEAYAEEEEPVLEYLRVPYMPHKATQILDVLVTTLAPPLGPGVLSLRLSGFQLDYTYDIFNWMMGRNKVVVKPNRKIWPVKKPVAANAQITWTPLVDSPLLDSGKTTSSKSKLWSTFKSNLKARISKEDVRAEKSSFRLRRRRSVVSNLGGQEDGGLMDKSRASPSPASRPQIFWSSSPQLITRDSRKNGDIDVAEAGTEVLGAGAGNGGAEACDNSQGAMSTDDLLAERKTSGKLQ